MKKILLFAISLTVVSFNSCKKPEIEEEPETKTEVETEVEQTFDNRKELVGDWNFEVFEVNYTWEDTIGYIADTSQWDYTGRIEYGEEKDKVVIHFSDDRKFSLFLYEEGEWLCSYSSENNECHSNGCHQGPFENNKINIYYSGQGAGDASGDPTPILDIKGVKIE